MLAPHSKGARRFEELDGVEVSRFRYASDSLERLAYEGGILSNLSAARWKWMLVPFFLLAQLLAFRRVCRTQQVAVVHAHWLVPQGLVCALARLFAPNPPLLVTSHGSDLNRLAGRTFGRLIRWILRAPDCITVVGEKLRTTMECLGIPASKIEVAPMGVDLLELFVPSSLPIKRAGILYVGRLVQGKGLEVLVEAFARVVAEIPETRLVIAGGGPLQADLTSLIASQGVAAKVDLLGGVANENLPELYRHAAVLAAPFTDEQGFGLTLVEAAGCGCNIVTTDFPSCRRIVSSAGFGTLIPPNDPMALAIALVAAVRQSSSGVVFNRSDALLQYDWNAVAVSYADRLATLANSRLHQ